MVLGGWGAVLTVEVVGEGGVGTGEEPEVGGRGEGVRVSASRAESMVSNWKRVSLTSRSSGVEFLWLDCVDTWPGRTGRSTSSGWISWNMIEHS